VSVATAQAFFHRFFAQQSFKKHDRFLVVQACLFLASKVEETPQKLQTLLVACHQVKGDSSHDGLDVKSKEYTQVRDKILLTERVLLHTMSFDLYVKRTLLLLLVSTTAALLLGCATAAPATTAFLPTCYHCYHCCCCCCCCCCCYQ